MIRVVLILGSALLLLAAGPLAAAERSGAAAPAAPDTLAGEVVAADGGAVGALRVFLRAGERVDSAGIAPSGRFVLPLPRLAPGDSVELLVDAAEPAARSYHPSLVRLGREDLAREQRFVLIPRRWTIPSGSHAGTQVEISLQRAFTPACLGCPGFFPRETALAGSAAPSLIEGWPEEVFPLRLAFDREHSAEIITPRDSVAFWQVVEKMEEHFGMPLFRPARYLETLRADPADPADVVLVWIVPNMRNPGLSTRGAHQGDILFAGVRLQRATLISSSQGPALITHELMHALGFGHTCSWRSVLADLSHCPRQRSLTPTSQDVAYAQLVRRVRALQREHGARWGIGAALAGERAALRPPVLRAVTARTIVGEQKRAG